jgi:hypothetical protein
VFVSGPKNPVITETGACSVPTILPSTGTYNFKLIVQDAVGYNSSPVSFSITAS